MTGRHSKETPTRSSLETAQMPEESVAPLMEADNNTLSPPEPPQIEQNPPLGEGTIAYEILLLQQRLAAYEHLHMEEMAELRREVERLSRTFLHATDPQLRPYAAEKHASNRE